MNNPTYSVDWTKEKLRFDHLKDLPLLAVNLDDIKLVVGIDAHILQASLERRLGPLGTPITVRMRLGWVAFSHLPGSEEEKIHVCRIDAQLQTQNDADLSQQLQQWINLETAPTSGSKSVARSIEDQKA